MFAFNGLPCGAGRRKDCMKDLCLLRHIDDVNPGFIEKSVMASVTKQINGLKGGTRNDKKQGEKYGMRTTVDRKARRQTRRNPERHFEEKVLLSLPTSGKKRKIGKERSEDSQEAKTEEAEKSEDYVESVIKQLRCESSKSCTDSCQDNEKLGKKER